MIFSDNSKIFFSSILYRKKLCVFLMNKKKEYIVLNFFLCTSILSEFSRQLNSILFLTYILFIFSIDCVFKYFIIQCDNDIAIISLISFSFSLTHSLSACFFALFYVSVHIFFSYYFFFYLQNMLHVDIYTQTILKFVDYYFFFLAARFFSLKIVYILFAYDFFFALITQII